MEQFGIGLLGAIPGREKASDKSEMITQITFGEPYKILGQEEKWLKVESLIDGYSCWIDKKQHNGISQEEVAALNIDSAKRCGSIFTHVMKNSDGSRIPVSFGALLPNYHEGLFEIKGETYTFEGRIARFDSNSLERHARRILNIPYLWGGKNSSGMDCSGFIQLLFACSGIKLPRDAWQQAEVGETVSPGEGRYGDLAYFQNTEGRITHVGMLLNSNEIIHASGHIRIDDFDEEGIRVKGSEEYSHTLKLIKRVF